MVVFGVALAVGSYVLFRISDTYVPMRTGPRRLMPYELFVPVLASLALIWGLGRLLRPGWLALVGDRRRAGLRRPAATERPHHRSRRIRERCGSWAAC